MVIQLQISWANARQRVKGTDRLFKSDTLIYNTGFGKHTLCIHLTFKVQMPRYRQTTYAYCPRLQTHI